MVLKGFFNKKNDLTAERPLYEAIVQQARHPQFYRDWEVPDSLDGRFELICIHVFLVLQRLKGEDENTTILGQRLHDLFFADMDESLREMGAGDLGVGKRVKKMVQAFYGRIAAYELGLRGASEELEAAIQRNLYGTLSDVAPESVAAMARYIHDQRDHLAHQAVADLSEGQVTFAPPPAAN
ncbi:MAG: ubiquinol-cytochrome C chaperone family protein [Pseudomonadota bacterium]